MGGKGSPSDNTGSGRVDSVDIEVPIADSNTGGKAILASDIDGDGRVSASDLGLLVSAWSDASRNGYPPPGVLVGMIP